MTAVPNGIPKLAKELPRMMPGVDDAVILADQSSREYFEIVQNLSLTNVILPCGSVIATMACSSSAAFKSAASPHP
jgi:hypothetical protein